MSKKIADLNVVELNDGRIGTIVHVYEDKTACVEIEETGELVDLSENDIKKVIWTQ